MMISCNSKQPTQSESPDKKDVPELAEAIPYIEKGEYYEKQGNKDSAIINYLYAASLYEQCGYSYYTQTMKYARKVLELDSTNFTAKDIMGASIPR
jgi:hypothetical protein